MQLIAAIVDPAHGLQGEVIMDMHNNDPEIMTLGSRLDVVRDQRSLTMHTVHIHKDHVLASLEECMTRGDAEALRSARLLVDAHPEENAWYPHELRGLQARAPSGNVLGTVGGLTPSMAQDLLLVATDRSTVVVPFVATLVPTVDVEGGFVVIDAPPDLFNEDAVSEYEGN